MWESMMKLFNKMKGKTEKQTNNSKDAAKERLHLVLMQDRANVSADFLELMKQEIIEVIKKYIEVDESAIDVRLTNKENVDGTNGAPALYANIPIRNIKDEVRQNSKTNTNSESQEKITKETYYEGRNEAYEKDIEQKIEKVIGQAQGVNIEPNSVQAQGVNMQQNSVQVQGMNMQQNSVQAQGMNMQQNSVQAQGMNIQQNSVQAQGMNIQQSNVQAQQIGNNIIIDSVDQGYPKEWENKENNNTQEKVEM